MKQKGICERTFSPDADDCVNCKERFCREAKPTKLDEAMAIIKQVNINCQNAAYSLDDVFNLGKAIEILTMERYLICECCS